MARSTPQTVLVLGGTTGARELAATLDADPAIRPITSLAGRLADPGTVAGEVRTGGFGGAAELARWIAAHGIAVVVDATHPFAAAISRNAAEACAQAGVPLVALRRPGWTAGPDDDWHDAADLADAAGRVADLAHAADRAAEVARAADGVADPARAAGRVADLTAGGTTGGSGRPRVLLAIGRQEAGAFAGVADAWFLIRAIEAPDGPLPPHHELVLARGPYALEDERRLLADHRIDLVVTKDSGGDATRAKLDAARERGIPVLVVRRPPAPEGPGIVVVASADAAAAAVRSALGA